MVCILMTSFSDYHPHSSMHDHSPGVHLSGNATWIQRGTANIIVSGGTSNHVHTRQPAMTHHTYTHTGIILGSHLFMSSWFVHLRPPHNTQPHRVRLTMPTTLVSYCVDTYSCLGSTSTHLHPQQPAPSGETHHAYHIKCTKYLFQTSLVCILMTSFSDYHPHASLHNYSPGVYLSGNATWNQSSSADIAMDGGTSTHLHPPPPTKTSPIGRDSPCLPHWYHITFTPIHA